MIKCPNCGSTAQTALVYPPTISAHTNFLVEGWLCGCGAHYSVEYERNEEGKWEFYTAFVDYFVKKGE